METAGDASRGVSGCGVPPTVPPPAVAMDGCYPTTCRTVRFWHDYYYGPTDLAAICIDLCGALPRDRGAGQGLGTVRFIADGDASSRSAMITTRTAEAGGWS